MYFQKKRVIAMLLAGGQGSRLKVLTEKTAKPAVPFGGKYRIIDFPLSNCVNSGIDTVGILTQYQPLELNEYIGNGQPWNLNKTHSCAQVLPPYERHDKKSGWYKGTANAIYQNIGFVDLYDLESFSPATTSTRWTTPPWWPTTKSIRLPAPSPCAASLWRRLPASVS